MPKYIENLKERIIIEAKKSLKEKNNLSIRDLAFKCDIAIGTIYNYFDNKETILASIITEDFKECLNKVDELINSSDDFITGAKGIYDGFGEFVAKYLETWKNYQDNQKYQRARIQYHPLLRKLLNEKMENMLKKYGYVYDEDYLELFGEVLINCTLQKDLGIANYMAYIRQLRGGKYE